MKFLNPKMFAWLPRSGLPQKRASDPRVAEKTAALEQAAAEKKAAADKAAAEKKEAASKAAAEMLGFWGGKFFNLRCDQFFSRISGQLVASSVVDWVVWPAHPRKKAAADKAAAEKKAAGDKAAADKTAAEAEKASASQKAAAEKAAAEKAAAEKAAAEKAEKAEKAAAEKAEKAAQQKAAKKAAEKALAEKEAAEKALAEMKVPSFQPLSCVQSGVEALQWPSHFPRVASGYLHVPESIDSAVPCLLWQAGRSKGGQCW